MKITDVCDVLFQESKNTNGKLPLSSDLLNVYFGEDKRELEAKLGIPEDVLETAFNKLVKDGYFIWSRSIIREIEITASGKHIRELGGYNHLREKRNERIKFWIPIITILVALTAAIANWVNALK